MTQEKKKIIPESESLSSEPKEDEEEDISIDNIEEYNSTFLDPNSEEIEYGLEMTQLLNTIEEEWSKIMK